MKTFNNSILIKKIIIINFGNDRKELIEWVYDHKRRLQQHEIITTANTAELLEGILLKNVSTLPWNNGGEFSSLRNLIAEGGATHLLCFGTETPQIFQPGTAVKMLELVKEHNIPFAFNKAGADIIIESLPTPMSQEDIEEHFEKSRPAMRYRSSIWPFKALSKAI